MKTIVIKTQKELDLLPKSFGVYTVIEIHSTDWIRVVARENSRVVARENSTVEAWENSTVEAWGNSTVVARENSTVVARENSTVEAFLCAAVFVFSVYVTIKKALDNSRVIYKKENCKRPEELGERVAVTEFSDLVKPTFEEWLKRGYVQADGITKKLVSQKTIGDVTIFEVTDSFEKEKSYVAKKGNRFAHGETIEKAKEDLRYKISDRDTSKYQSWTKEDVKPTEELIEAYMTITGACSMGTKEFCQRMNLKENHSIQEVIDMTIGNYGYEQFKQFFEVRP